MVKCKINNSVHFPWHWDKTQQLSLDHSDRSVCTLAVRVFHGVLNTFPDKSVKYFSIKLMLLIIFFSLSLPYRKFKYFPLKNSCISAFFFPMTGLYEYYECVFKLHVKFLPFCKEQVTNNPKACQYTPHHFEKLERIQCALPALCAQQSCETPLSSCEIIPVAWVQDPEIKLISSKSQFSALTLSVRVPLFSIQIKLISACIKAHVLMKRLFHGLNVQALQQLGQFMWREHSRGKCQMQFSSL